MSDSHAPAEPPVALLTGACRGIGLATARLLAERGIRVFVTSRVPLRHTELELEVLPLDPTDPDSCGECVHTALRRAGRLDILVNNIGSGIAGAFEEVTVAEAHAVFEANLWSAVRMTQAVLPHMRARRDGRIIAVSSMAGLIGIPYRGAYTASKFALESMFEALRHEVAPWGIHVSIIKPSGVASGAADRVPVAALRLPDYQPARDRLSARFNTAMRNGMPPERVARAILRVTHTSRPRLRYPVGNQVRALGAIQRLLPQHALTPALTALFTRLGRSA